MKDTVFCRDDTEFCTNGTAFSLKSFFGFLSVAKREAMITYAQEYEWRNTLMEFQLVMKPAENRDLRKVSVAALCKRYDDFIRENQIIITPVLMARYESQLENALGNFIAYQFNPLQYRHSRKAAKQGLEASARATKVDVSIA